MSSNTRNKPHLNDNEGTFENKPSNSNLVPGTPKTAKLSCMRRKKQKPVVKTVPRNYISVRVPKPYKYLGIVRGKEWYVQYYYIDPDAKYLYRPVRVRGGLNRIKNINEREIEARVLLKEIKYKLQTGFVPKFAAKKMADQIVKEELKEINTSANWPMHKAIFEYRKFIAKHGYASRTLETYKGYIDDLDEWVTDMGLTSFIAADFTEFDLLPLLDDAAEKNDWSGRTYNNYLEFFGSFFNRCNKLEKVTNRGVKYKFDKSGVDLKITTPQVNKAFPPLIEKKIKKQLDLPGNELLRDYCEWISLSFMRPMEIRNLKVGDIDIDSRHIRIMGKTGDRLVPISNQLLDLITKKGLMGLDADMYVFGEALRTSFKRGGIDYPLEKFNVIRVALKLPAVYKIYSFKPTYVIKMINAGFSDKEIRMLTGHKTQEAFEKYKRDLVIDNSHVMKGRAIDF